MAPEAMGDFVVKLADHLGITRLHAVGPDVGTLALLFAAVKSPSASAILGFVTAIGSANSLGDFGHFGNRWKKGSAFFNAWA
jgi:hypothetical protein